jgi:hypothetical protein
MRLLIALLVWAAAIGGAAGISNVVAKSIHTAPGTTGGSVDPSSIKSTDASSLFRTANLTKALGTIRSHVGADARLDDVALYPGYLSVNMVKNNVEYDVYVDANGRFQETNTGSDGGGQPLFPSSWLTASAPATLEQRISTKAHIPASQLHYMVLDVDSEAKKPAPQWDVYTVTGSKVEYLQADGKNAGGRLYEYVTNSSTGLKAVGR